MPATPFIKALELQRYKKLKLQLEEFNDTEVLWVKLGHCCRALGYIDQAIAAFEQSLHIGGNAMEAERVLAILRGEPVLKLANENNNPSITPFLLQDDFLSKSEIQCVWSVYKQHCSSMRESEVEGNLINPNHRKSKAINLKSNSNLSFFKNKVLDQLMKAYSVFQIPFPEDNKLSLELTSHADGGFFNIHNDIDPNNPVRLLSYVYYFHTQPKKFDGGELHLLDTSKSNLEYNHRLTCINPINNRLVIFPSYAFHRVCEVSLNSTDNIDARHTLNGWHLDLNR